MNITEQDLKMLTLFSRYDIKFTYTEPNSFDINFIYVIEYEPLEIQKQVINSVVTYFTGNLSKNTKITFSEYPEEVNKLLQQNHTIVDKSSNQVS